ncbi:MAG: hypothetical protein ERJ67_00550, partial [Aphanocapsa feldmannii 277cV]
IKGSDASTTSHTVTGLSNDTTYTFVLRAVNASGNGAASATVSATPTATPVPAVPSGLTAMPGDSEVVLSWDDPDDALITGYEVSSNGGTSFTAISGSDASTTSHTVTGLTNGTSYRLAVRALNVEGASAAATLIVTPSAISGVPQAPGGLSATVASTQVSLSWNNPDNSSISGYAFSINGGSTYRVISGSDANTTSHTVTGLINGVAYRFAVRAFNGSGNGGPATLTAAPVALPAAPDGLTAAGGERKLLLRWNDPDNTTITGYELSSNGGSTFTAISGSNAGTTSHTVTGLTNGTTYSFTVRALNASGEGASATVSGAPAPLPSAPSRLVATPGDGEILLSWKNPGNPAIAGYELAVNSTYDLSQTILFNRISGSNTSTTSYRVTGVDNGVENFYRVRAVNGFDEKGGVATVVTTARSVSSTKVPAAPEGLSVWACSDICLSWADPDDDRITRYELGIVGGSGVSYMNTDVFELYGNRLQTYFLRQALVRGREYTFALRALNKSVRGGVATVVFPASPTGLSATAVGHGQVLLRWDNPDNPAISGYKVSIKGDGNRSYTISGSDANTTSHTVTGLTNGTKHRFMVQAKVGAGVGWESSWVSATPVAVPAAPQGLAATAGDSQVILAWTASDNDTISGYEVSRDGGSTFSAISGSSASTTGHTVTGLTNGNSYTFAVRAVNASGDGDVATVSATPVLPSSPTSLRATSGDGNVALSWADPGNVTIIGYEVSSNGGATFSAISGSDASTTSHTVTGLTNGTTYTLALRAASASGQGESSMLKAIPMAVANEAPAAPGNLSVTAGDGEVSLRWSDPGDTTISGYEVSSDSGSTYNAISGSDASTTSHTVTGLTNGTPYTFALRALNASGNGAASTLTAVVPLAVPTAPSDLSATVADSEISLSWSDPDNATITAYEVSTNGGSTYSTIHGSGASTTSHRLEGLSNRTTYTLALRAVNASGEGASSTLTARPLAKPSALIGLTPNSVDGEMWLLWLDPDNTSITAYELSTDGGAFVTISPTNATSRILIYKIKGLTTGTSYNFALRALNASGYSPVATAVAELEPVPLPPSDLRAIAGDSQVILRWDNLNSFQFSFSRFELSIDGGETFETMYGAGSSTTSHKVTGLTNGTT